MESINSYVTRKMKLRKILMIIFSLCTVILLCGILNSTMENGENTDSRTNIYSSEAEMRTDIRKNAPREFIMDQRDRNIRLYSAFILGIIMAGTFAIDFLFIRCPKCSGHIYFSINPVSCRHCGNSFSRKENEK